MPVNLPDNSHKAKPKALASRSFAARFSTILTSRYCTSASIGALLQCASAVSKVVSLQATQGPCIGMSNLYQSELGTVAFSDREPQWTAIRLAPNEDILATNPCTSRANASSLSRAVQRDS